jgi:ketosteroid isomerase-like protein
MALLNWCLEWLRKELVVPGGLCDISTMLRYFNLPLMVSLLAIAPISALAQEKSDAATIRSLEMKWTESYKERSVDILSSLLSEDFMITIEDGSVYSKVGYISHSADPATHVHVAELSDLKVRVHGDAAIVTGAYHEIGESNGKPYEYHDRLTDVWMKSGGKWQVVASHYSVPVK